MELVSSVIRHDVANRSLSIAAYAAMLQENIVKNGTDEERKSLIQKIVTNSNQLNIQVQLWREYESNSRVSWHLLENIEKICQKIYFQSGVTIDCDKALGGIKVYASPLVSKVFENLIDNSIRHGNATKIWTSHYFSPEGDLVIVYEDNGCGIPVKDKEAIFRKGFGKNTGLGLFLTREILKVTDVGIFEDGEPEKGARFKITVPKDYYRQQ